MHKFILLSALLPSIAAAGTVTITNNIDGVGPHGKIKPVICIKQNNNYQTIKPGGYSQMQTKSGDPKFDPEFVDGDLRFDGCDPNKDPYLGYIKFIFGTQGANVVYSPPKGVHIEFANPTNTNGSIGGGIRYTPIKPNQIEAPKSLQNWQFAGVNLSGLEFGKVINPFVVPNLSKEDATIKEGEKSTPNPNSDLKEMESFIKAGMNTVRVPISWGYLQLDGPGVGELNEAYYNSYIKPLLQTLTKSKIYTIVDLHAYMRYSKFGVARSGCFGNDPCPGGEPIFESGPYKDVWRKLYTLIQRDPDINKDYIMLDLMNEPVGVPGDKVLTIQADLINLLRNDLRFDGYILIEGNSWTGLHSWFKKFDDSDYSNATLFTKDNIGSKANIQDFRKILINVHQYFDYDFSGTKEGCIGVGEFDKLNVDKFYKYLHDNQINAIVTEFGTNQYSFASCKPILEKFMQTLLDDNKKNGYGIVGWTVWSAGHGWGGDMIRIKADSEEMKALQPFLK